MGVINSRVKMSHQTKLSDNFMSFVTNMSLYRYKNQIGIDSFVVAPIRVSHTHTQNAISLSITAQQPLMYVPHNWKACSVYVD